MTLVTKSKQNLLSHVISSTDSVLIDLFSKFIAKYVLTLETKAFKQEILTKLLNFPTLLLYIIYCIYLFIHLML